MKPDIDQMVAELKAAGWIAVRPTAWQAPDGSMRVGPAGAWRHMKAMQEASGLTPEAFGILRQALQRIADNSDCQCEHNTADCCANMADHEYRCPGCIAARALKQAEGSRP